MISQFSKGAGMYTPYFAFIAVLGLSLSPLMVAPTATTDSRSMVKPTHATTGFQVQVTATHTLALDIPEKYKCGRKKAKGKLAITTCTWRFKTKIILKKARHGVILNNTSRETRTTIVHWDVGRIRFTFDGKPLDDGYYWTYGGSARFQVPPGLHFYTIGGTYDVGVHPLDSFALRASAYYAKSPRERTANSLAAWNSDSTE